MSKDKNQQKTKSHTVAVSKRLFDFNCLKPKDVLTHTCAPTTGPWLRTSGSGAREDVYFTTSRNVRRHFVALPLKMFHEIIDCDFKRGYTAVGMKLFRTCKGLTTGSPLSVYLAVLCVFYAIYNMNNTARSTIHLIEDYLGPVSTFKWGLLEWIDDFLLLTSTPHAELKAMMNTVLQQHLGRFGVTEEAADNYVGLNLRLTTHGLKTSASNPNAATLTNLKQWNGVPLVKRRFQHCSGSQPKYQQRGLLKSQLLRCIDCALTIPCAIKEMRTLAKEFQILGCSRQLAIVWSAVSNTYPYSRMDEPLPRDLEKRTHPET